MLTSVQSCSPVRLHTHSLQKCSHLRRAHRSGPQHTEGRTLLCEHARSLLVLHAAIRLHTDTPRPSTHRLTGAFAVTLHRVSRPHLRLYESESITLKVVSGCRGKAAMGESQAALAFSQHRQFCPWKAEHRHAKGFLEFWICWSSIQPY